MAGQLSAVDECQATDGYISVGVVVVGIATVLLVQSNFGMFYFQMS